MTIQELLKILQTGGYEVVSHNLSPKQLRMMGRVRNPLVAGWLMVVDRLIEVSATKPWSIDISKHYFRKPKLMFAWRVIVQVEDDSDVSEFFPEIGKVVLTTPKAKQVVDEIPLIGARADRNTPSAGNRGKGAQGVFKAVTGPAAAAALTRG